MQTQDMLSGDDVKRMSYPDFVAFLEQDNSPPGGVPTIDRWIQQAGIAAHSRVLDLACSTGFSGRTIATNAKCAVSGIDMSAAAIVDACRKSGAAGLDQADFIVGDATALPYPNSRFDVAVAGSCFGFIQPREVALDEVHRVLVSGGRLCIANFTYHTPPPEQALDQVAAHAGFRPEAHWTREYWNTFFGRRFVLAHEDTIRLKPFSDQEVICHVARFVKQHKGRLASVDANIQNAAFQRLLRDRLVFNDHYRFQMRNIQVWQRRD